MCRVQRCLTLNERLDCARIDKPLDTGIDLSSPHIPRGPGTRIQAKPGETIWGATLQTPPHIRNIQGVDKLELPSAPSPLGPDKRNGLNGMRSEVIKIANLCLIDPD